MFLHMPTLKKLLKSAYNQSKLIIGRLEDGLLIECGTFMAWLEWYSVPNKVKAALIELAGELPEEGHVFTAGKEGNQYEIPERDVWRIHDGLRAAEKRYIVTPVVLDGDYHFLQEANSAATKIVAQKFIDLIDPSERDYAGGEGSIAGPYGRPDSDIIYWATDLCILAVRESRLYKGLSRAIRNALETINFEGDYSRLEDQ